MKPGSGFVSGLISKAIAWTYFNKVVITGKGNIPLNDPVLFVAIHRNGAVDGFVLSKAIKDARFIIGKNISKSPIVKLLFNNNIDVYRHPRSIAQQKENLMQLKYTAELIEKGEKIVIFPEGTSKLGPTLLPVQVGVAHLIALALKILPEASLRVIPVGLHYSRGYEFRSDVEIYFGPARTITRKQYKNLDELKALVESLLKEVAATFPDEANQKLGELFADTVLHISPSMSHRNICIQYTKGGIPPELLSEISRLTGSARHPRPPAAFQHSMALQVVLLLILTPLVAAGFALNTVPLFGAFLAARRFADDDNTISLWRIIVGGSLLVFQIIACLLLLLILPSLSSFLMVAIYAGLSLLAMKIYRQWKDGARQFLTMCSARRKDALILNRRIKIWLSQLT